MDSDKLITAFIVLVVIAIFGFSLGRGILVDEKVAVEALDKQGFNDVKIVKKNWFLVGWRGCGDSDAAKFTAIAKNPRNETVEVFVCVGWPFKGATIRTGCCTKMSTEQKMTSAALIRARRPAANKSWEG